MKNEQPLSQAKQDLLAKMLRGEATDVRREPEIGKRKAGVKVPLTAAQRQIWLHAMMAPTMPLYNESITFHRLGSFDVAALTLSLKEIVRRHAICRTSFSDDSANVTQIVHDDVPFHIVEDDVSDLPLDERDAAALKIGSADAIAPIDIHTVPLFRARLVKLSDSEHRLYLTLHHLIFDGVSIYRIVLPELAELYDHFAFAKEMPSTKTTLDYADYAVWQVDYLQSAKIQKQIDYWRRILADPPKKLELPADRMLRAVESHAGSMETFSIPQSLSVQLVAFSHARGATLYMTLLAAFKALLHRYSGAEDIIVGGVTDLRRRSELQNVVGYFLNTFALRTRPKASMPFSHYLEEVGDVVAGALNASEVPFDEVITALKIRPVAGSHPLFNVLFSMEPPAGEFPDGWALTQMDVGVGAAKFDLYLELDERPEGILGRFLYSTELFDSATIQRMIGHWLALLQAVVDSPDCRLSDLPFFGPDDARLRSKWRQTTTHVPATSLPAVLADHAARRPEAVAIACDNQTWTYRRLDETASSIATALQERGTKHGALVAVCLERSPEMVAALLGILRSGAAYLPLDASFPRARIEQIIADARPDCVVTELGLVAALPRDTKDVVLLDDLLRSPPGAGTVQSAIAGSDLAYVLYTSGSTGKPKGVEIEHRALMNLLFSMQADPGFDETDELLAITTLTFDIAALELFLPLVCGGRVTIASKAEVRDPARLAALIARARPTVMQATPATWKSLIEAGWHGDAGLRILCGGEAMPRELANQLSERCAALWNVYGPTETTIWSTLERVEPGRGLVPIGRPIANTIVEIVDSQGRPVPIGVTGELCIGGAGLARGYRHRPDLTEQRFGALDGLGDTRFYRTGDFARQTGDGKLFCLGRTDAEEKIRGFRIAVEEVESALLSHDDVAAAAVRSWPDASGERILVAYLVGRGSTKPSATSVRQRVAEILPDYMIPARFVALEVLPLTSSGKIDRKNLPAPEAEANVVSAFSPPQGATEEKLAALWRDILRVQAVGRDDSFFDLGGNSLLAAKLLSRIEVNFGRSLSVVALFGAHQLAAMAARLEGDGSFDVSAAVPLQPKGWRTPLLWLNGGPYYLPLARSLGLDQPFIGVPVDTTLPNPNTQSVTEVIDHTISLIKQIRPKGPFYLGGHCAGGNLAFEVAVRLAAAGADIPLVVMVDTINPIELEQLDRVSLFKSRLSFHLQQMRIEEGGALNYLIKSIRNTYDRALAGRTRAFGKPPSYDGDVVLVQRRERPDVFGAGAGWPPVVGGRFREYLVSGNHGSMFEHPHVTELAAVIRAALLEADDIREMKNRAGQYVRQRVQAIAVS